MKPATKVATTPSASTASAPRKQRAHGEITVFLRPDRGSAYYYRLRVDGKNITKCTGCTDKRAAQKNAALAARAARARDWSKLDHMTVRNTYATTGELLQAYADHATATSATAAADRFLRYVREAFATATPEDISTRESLAPDHLRAWIHAQERSGRSPAGIHSDVQTIKSIVARTRAHIYNSMKLPDLLPFRAVTGGSAKSAGYQPIAREVLRRMDSAARIPLRRHDPRTWGVYWIMRRAGLRNIEVAALRWEWIEEQPDGSADIVLIPRDGWDPKGSAGRVPISRRFLRLLRAVFPHTTGPVIPRRNPTDIKRLTERTINAFCRPFIPPPGKGAYMLRKEFGSRIAARDGIEIASRLLRHADITTTFQHYHSLLKRPDPL